MTRLSKRFRWDLTPNPQTQLIEQRRVAGLPVLDLTVSNPSTAGVSPPEELVLGPLRDPRATIYRPDPRGLRETREAVAAYYADHGATVDPDDIFLTASTSEAYAWLFKLLTDPGGEILVPRPSYPLFDFLAGLEQLTTYTYPASTASLEKWRSENSRLAVAVHPNNPTGAWLGDLNTDGLPLLIDEVFLDYPLSQRGTTHAGADTGDAFVLSGLSKICALPQMKLGWIVLAGSARRDEVRNLLELVADSYLSASTPVQWAAIEWLRNRTQMTAALRERIATNQRLALEKLPGRAEEMGAGWSLVIELDQDADEERVVTKLAKDGVLVQPGYFYDYDYPVLVVSLMTPQETFSEGVARLHSSLFS